MLHKRGGGDTSSHSAGPNLFNLSLLAPPLQAIVTSRGDDNDVGRQYTNIDKQPVSAQTIVQTTVNIFIDKMTKKKIKIHT